MYYVDGVKMTTYISLLRGINVSGQKKIKMEELITLYESLDLKHIKTYVQSGNVIFDSSQKDISELSTMIQQKIKQVFGFPVSVFLRTQSELQRIIATNPFLNETSIDINKLYVTFLFDAPIESALSQMKEINTESDEFIISNKEILLHCPKGYGRTKYSNNFFEKKLGITATTRNWKTVTQLFAISATKLQKVKD
jgi:uncharacterized protein (DUF1697 family)